MLFDSVDSPHEATRTNLLMFI